MEIRSEGAVLALLGDVDVRCSGEVREAVYRHLAHHSGNVVVDLSGVTSIDLTALRVLAVATRRAGNDGHRLTLRGCGPAVRRLLHLSHLIRVVDLDRAVLRA